MSILNQNNNEPTKEERLARKVNEIKGAPKRLAETMALQWEQAFRALWEEDKFGGPEGEVITVAEKLAALGTDAQELFEINSAFTTFMLTQLAGKRDDLVAKIQEKISKIPNFTVNADGTVVLDK